jgi:hypothetical protein
MTRRRRSRSAAAALCLLACGCSVAREIPRDQYAGRPERRHVRVETRAGTRYEFDQVRVAGDSLFGVNREDVEGPFEQYRTVGLPLDEVARMSVRQVDWYRSGLIAGVAGAVVLAAILTQTGGGNGGGPPPGPCGPRPCP